MRATPAHKKKTPAILVMRVRFLKTVSFDPETMLHPVRPEKGAANGSTAVTCPACLSRPADACASVAFRRALRRPFPAAADARA